MKYYLSVIIIITLTFLISSVFQLTKGDPYNANFVEAAIDETRERWKDIMKQEGEDALREYLKSSIW